MSCITELLKLKGDRKILPIVFEDQELTVVIEGGGQYRGFEYLITFTDNGTRCGYVALPSSHPLNNHENNYPDLECHGGCTFFGDDHAAKQLLSQACADKWIGFDCFHHDDLQDLEQAKEYFSEKNTKILFYKQYPHYVLDFGKKRSFDYVKRNCQKIIHQLIRMVQND